MTSSNEQPHEGIIPTTKAIMTIIGVILLVLVGIHMQIPDQAYCNQMLQEKGTGAFGTVYYLESQVRYDFSFNQSKCIYDQNGSFIANPKYSIWGIRI